MVLSWTHALSIRMSPAHCVLANSARPSSFNANPTKTLATSCHRSPIDENESDASFWLVKCRMTKTIQQRYNEEELLFCNRHRRPPTSSIF